MLDLFSELCSMRVWIFVMVSNVCRQKSTLFLEKNDDDVKCMFADSLIRASKLSECGKVFSGSLSECLWNLCVFHIEWG